MPEFRRIPVVRVLIAALAFSSGALAQDTAPPASPPAAPLASPPLDRAELGVRYWLSTGETKHAHNAQGVVPSLGNPTSVLLYENLDAHVLEIFGRQVFSRDWFLKGMLGVGRINTGSFEDEDFNRGQVKFSDTTSSVSGGSIAYGVFDIGHHWRLKQDTVRLGVFAGYSQWNEEVEASGATDHLGFIGGDIDRSVKVINNNVTWKALRVGFAGQFVFGRARLGVDLALIPYATYRNEDSHLLRTSPGDLGPAPNIVLEGDGRGIQLDAELGYEIARRTIVSLGWRYWYMESTDGKRSLPNFPGFTELPVTELYTQRMGATLAVRHLW